MLKKLVQISAVTLVLIGCSPKESSSNNDPAEAQSEPVEIKNCLIIVLDAFHAKHSSLYGAKAPTTPHLEKWAKRGVTFNRAYSQSTYTLASAWSYFNGQYPYHLEQLNFMRDFDTPLPVLFKNQGFDTAGFSENPFINKTYKFDRGFDELVYMEYRSGIEDTVDQISKGVHQEAKAYQNYQRSGDVTQTLFEKADSWISERPADPWFCYMHLLRPHNPYFAPDPFFSQFVDEKDFEDPEDHYKQFEFEVVDRYYGKKDGFAPEAIQPLLDLYHSNIAYADHLMNEFLTELESRGQLKDTVVVVMSDHGEAFGEHGELLHNKPPYDEQIHVPLVMIFPENYSLPNRTVDTPVALMDLLPTLEDLFELTVDSDVNGYSMLPLLERKNAPHHYEIISQHAATRTLTTRQGSKKLLIEFNEDFSTIKKIKAFDLKADPEEKDNIYKSDGTYQNMLKSLLSHVRSHTVVGVIQHMKLSDSEKELLETLGYMGHAIDNDTGEEDKKENENNPAPDSL
jgi:arylsulfatase A-like enzyme